MKKRYGEITALDFPQWTKDNFPGVTMDLRLALFGDVLDAAIPGRHFDPTTAAGKRWLDQLATKLVVTGTRIQHVSNNAPTNSGPTPTPCDPAGHARSPRTAGWLQDARHRLDADELAAGVGPIDPAERYAGKGWHPQLRPRADARCGHRVYSARWPTSAATSIKVMIENAWPGGRPGEHPHISTRSTIPTARRPRLRNWEH